MLEITRGDRKPPLEITIADADEAATFSSLSASACLIQGELDGVVVINAQPDSYTPAPDNKSAVLRREWGVGETDVEGRLWLSVEVTWPDGRKQTFPGGSRLYIDIRRAPGDA